MSDTDYAANLRHTFRAALDALREAETVGRLHRANYGVPACSPVAQDALRAADAFEHASPALAARLAHELGAGGPTLACFDYARELVVFPWHSPEEPCPIHGIDRQSCPYG